MKSTLIIGAGPAGLAIAGTFAQNGYQDYSLLESSDSVGNSWRHHYDRLHLHTVKQLSHLPYQPFPKEYPLYVSRSQVVQYLEDYASKYNIQPSFHHHVSRISHKNGHWEVLTNKGKFEAEHVVVATGVNNIPKVPSWPGQEDFGGDISHSRSYKNPSMFMGKRVLVIGMGNTGAEIAYDLADHGVDVCLSVRSPISLVPRDLNGQPVQLTARRLAKIPFGLGDWLGSQIRKVYFGNVEKYGLQISKIPPAVQLRETGKTPVIDIGTIAAIKSGKIKVIPDIESFETNGVVTKAKEHVEFDCAILATGYLTSLEKFIPGVGSFLDKHGLPSQPIGTGSFSKMYFIGYDNYKLGGILGTINSDSKKITNKILSTLSN